MADYTKCGMEKEERLDLKNTTLFAMSGCDSKFVSPV